MYEKTLYSIVYRIETSWRIGVYLFAHYTTLRNIILDKNLGPEKWGHDTKSYSFFSWYLPDVHQWIIKQTWYWMNHKFFPFWLRAGEWGTKPQRGICRFSRCCFGNSWIFGEQTSWQAESTLIRGWGEYF